MAIFVSYYLKDQILKLMREWNCSEPLPTKKTRVIIGFPPSAQYRLGIITKHDQKSTYGKPLYKLLLTNQDPLCLTNQTLKPSPSP